jgi:hypothetical protein
MLNDLKYYRQALGINMVWNSYPIIFFVRDGLGIGPQGSLFTIGYWMIGLLLMWPGNLFARLYSPNSLLLFFWGGFISLSFIYWKYYSPVPVPDGSRELLTYIIPFAFLFLLLYYPNDKVDYILITMVGYTLIASAGMVYYIVTNPNWHIGERAGISYAAMQGHSNPHTYANSALACIIASTILMWKSAEIYKKIFYLFAIVFSFIVMLLCRTNTSLITLILITIAALVFNSRAIVKAVASAKSLKVGIVVYIIVTIFFAQFATVGGVLSAYSSTFLQRFNRVIYTASGVQVDQTTPAEIDHSASYRIESIKRTQDLLSSQDMPLGEILVGQGYKFAYMDMPSLDALVNQGVLGFLFYNGFWFMIALTMLLQYVRPASNVSLFIAYFTPLMLLYLTSGGQTVDIGAWFVQAFFVRFLGVYSPTPTPPLQTATA